MFPDGQYSWTQVDENDIAQFVVVRDNHLFSNFLCAFSFEPYQANPIDEYFQLR